uniref:Uncharacterized protein n=1 Tax=Arundo donax TaxID=35708 RepID=A0A0A9F7C7_ARUDO
MQIQHNSMANMMLVLQQPSLRGQGD